MTKPPYRVPTMAEIDATPPVGRSAISLFAGAGGSSLGYRMAGIQMRWASEFVEAAREVYLRNSAPGTVVDGRDIRDVTADDILRQIGMKPGELDIVDGSPPCASFSTAGNRERDWGKVKKYSDTKQRTDDLFNEYIRIIKGIRPKAFVAENVSGLVKGVAKGVFIRTLEGLRACGYRVRAQVVEAKWLGVPQDRRRLIFIGIREDLNRDPLFPAPLPYYYTVRDAMPWIVRGRYGRQGWRTADAPSPRVSASLAYSPSTSGQGMELVEAETSFEGTAIEKEAKLLRPGETSSRYYMLQRLPIDGPAQTVSAAGGGRGVAGVFHPTERRKLTIAELKRICAFPDDFQLTGTYQKQWERLGRAVPPVMMKAIALAVLKTLDEADQA